MKSRSLNTGAATADDRRGRRAWAAVVAGGMVYVSSIGPVDPETGQLVNGAIKEQTRQCLRNLKAQLEAAGSSLDKVVWANWSLREPSEFDEFNEEWAARPADDLAAACTRRAGFRVSLGVIATL